MSDMTPQERAVDALATPDFEAKDSGGRLAEALEVMELLDLGDDPMAAAELVDAALAALAKAETPNILQTVYDVTGWTDKRIGELLGVSKGAVTQERMGRSGVRWTPERRSALITGLGGHLDAIAALLRIAEEFATA